MNIGDFYEREEVINFAEVKRSELCYKLIIDLIAKNAVGGNKGKILDIGCGTGRFIAKFKEVYEVFGVDVSRMAIQRTSEAGINVHRIDVSIEKLPYAKRTFDVIHMGDVVEHLVNPDFAIKEARRVLKQDGSLVLSTPNLASWYNRILLLLGIQPIFSEVSTEKIFGRPGTEVVGHLRLFTLKALTDFLIYNGFKIVKVVGTPYHGLPKALKKIDEVLAKITSLSSILIVVGEKSYPRKTNSSKG